VGYCSSTIAPVLYGIIDSTTLKTFFEMVCRLDASKLCLFWTVCGRSRGMMELGARNGCEPGRSRFQNRFEDSRWSAADVFTAYRHPYYM